MSISPVPTEDGSFTFYSSYFNEHYHSLKGAQEESYKKFILPAQLEFYPNPVHVLDIGFGLGYNSLTLIQEAQKINKPYKIHALELFPEVLELGLKVHSKENQTILTQLINQKKYLSQKSSIEIFFGDARKNLKNLPCYFYHCVFLDPFSPPKNPELWSIETFNQLFKLLHPKGKILTYSSALSVISGFKKAGFFVGYTPPVKRQRGGLMACKEKEQVLFPLSEKDEFLLATSFHGLPNSQKKGEKAQEIKDYREKLSSFVKNKGFLLPHKKCLKLYQSNL